jgi:Flp pilus assembly pilin Flp
MKKFLLKLWQNEEGAETAEWLVIVAILVVVAIAVYDATLVGALDGIVGQISAAVNGIPASL